MINNFLPEKFIYSLGWSLIHSLWIGIVVLIILSAVLLILKNHSARERYSASVFALSLIFILTLSSFFYEMNNTSREEFPTRIEINELAEEIASAEISGVIPKENNFSFKEFYLENLPLFTSLYFLGLLIMIIRFTGGYVYTFKLKRKSVYSLPADWNKKVDNIKTSLNIKEFVEVYESGLVKVPVAIGFLKPVILLPLGMISGMPPQQVEAILLHELSHISNKDYLLNFQQSLIEVVLFFNPAVWIISRIIREEREIFCDEKSLFHFENKREYIEALLSISINSSKSNYVLTAVSNKNQLSRRINKMIKMKNNTIDYTTKIAATFLLLIAFTGMTFIACSSSSETQTEEVKKKEVVVNKNSSAVKDSSEKKSARMIIRNNSRNKNNGEEKYIIVKRGNSIPKVDSIHIDMSQLKANLDEMRKNLKDLKINIDFNADSLRESISRMKIKFNSDTLHFPKIKVFQDSTLRIRLRGLDSLVSLRDAESFHEIEVNFNSEEFRKEMEGLEKEMEKVREELAENNIELQIMSEEIAEQAAEMSEEFLEDFDFDIDIDIDMEELEEEIERVKEELENIDINLENVDEFVDETTSELIEDGYIENRDEYCSMKFRNENVLVNGENISDDYSKKYREIFKKYFNKYPDEESFELNK